MNQNILIKGVPQKSKSALIVTIIGVLLILASFYVAIYVYLKGYPRYVWDVPYRRIYYHSFVNFYIESFFVYNCYGWMLIIGALIVIVGIIMKLCTEKCELTVTDEAVFGKRIFRKKVYIPLNEITSIKPWPFSGVLISSITGVSIFPCFKNRNDIIKVLTPLITKSQQTSSQTINTINKNSNEIERLKDLKVLLDDGVITQEEFELMKNQILNL